MADLGRPRGTAKGKPEPDTKDFAQHLRTVHFTLLASCLALMVVVTQPTRTELRDAHQQARDLVELSRVWDEEFVQKEGARQVSEFRQQDSPASGKFDLPLDLPRALAIAGERFNVTFRKPNWGFIRPMPATTMLDVMTSDGAELRVKSPKDLADFRILWDQLDNIVAWGGGDLYATACIIQGSRHGGTAEAWHSWKPIEPSPEYKALTLSLGAVPMDEVAAPQPLRGRLRHAFVSAEGAPQLVIPTVSDIPVAIVDGQKLLIKSFRERWRHGPYVRAFEELYSVTKNYEDVGLSTIERIVQSEAERSKDVFEAFGVKFPIETTARWGVLLVLGIQVYFFLHLAEFTRRRIYDASIAWIGLYRARVPRALFVISAFLVPVAVVFYVALKSGVGHPSALKAWLFAIGATAVSGVVSYTTAVRYRAIETGPN